MDSATEISFTPLRKLVILPPDAVLDRPYSLSNSELCSICRAAVVKISSASPVVRVEKYRQDFIWHDLGTFRELESRKECPLCQLIVNGIAQLCPPYARPMRLDGQISLAVVLYINNVANSVGHVDLPVCASNKYIGTIREMEKIKDVDKYKILTNTSTSIKSAPCECCALPKRCCQVSPSQIDYSAVRAWVQNCESTHQKCHDLGYTSAHWKKTGYPSILIHVGRRCLVPVEFPPRYCALSYVYGGSQIFRTSTQTFEKLQTTGSLDADWVQLPAVIRDAISLTESIGEQYLWTDSLCIINDHKDGLDDQIKCMDVIYNRAVLTIAVVSGEHAEQPIPGVLPYSRRPLPFMKLWDRNIFFCPVPVNLELHTSPYEQRAWILQERLLSPRILYVNNSGVSFYCRESSHLELIWTTDPEGLDTAISFDQADAFPQNPLDLHSLMDDEGDNNKVQHQGVDEPTQRSRWIIYFDLVRIYCQRKLTYESDILRAFSGIQVVLEEQFYHTAFFAGIPILAMGPALHWIPGMERGDRIASTVTSIKRREFPSFSWIGWKTPVQWLEAVCLPEWWQFQNVAEIDVDPESSHLNIETHMTFCSGLSAQVCKEVVYPERLLNPGDEYPLQLIKIFDRSGRWCGRLCDLTTDTIDNAHGADLQLLLLSTCAARKILISDIEERQRRIYSDRYQVPFDTDVFPTSHPDGTAARLVNLLLVKPESITRNLFHRIGLCQLHQDVWESLEKVQRKVMLG